jgi:hypothetical protein
MQIERLLDWSASEPVWWNGLESTESEDGFRLSDPGPVRIFNVEPSLELPVLIIDSHGGEWNVTPETLSEKRA